MSQPHASELTPQRFTVTRADLIRYAGAAGDFNPIHWSDRVATSVGLPGVIAHGMFTMALAGRAVERWAGGTANIVEYGVRFAKPVVVPDDDAGVEIVVSGELGEAGEDGTVPVKVSCVCDGQQVLGMAKAVIRRPAAAPGPGTA